MHWVSGQYIAKRISVDPVKKILTYPGSHGGSVAVELDNYITDKTCWKVKNSGQQEEGLFEGDALDYMVSTLLEDDFNMKLEIKKLQ